MTRIAVIGASGFIGNRAVEMLCLGGRHEVVPVVRRASGLALACRFNLPGRVADGLEEAPMAAALEGCDSVVVAVAGPPETIVGTIDPIHAAAEQAGVRRMVYLSSASVHGQAPAPGTDEGSPLSLRQPFPYNRAKILAERRIRKLRSSGRCELVILRPGIVHGPRSQWTGGFADQLLAGEAFLADGGSGICNAIYVDNVVHAIERAITADSAAVDGEAFLIGDLETITWRALVEPIAQALGLDVDDLPQPSSAAILNRREPLARRLVRPAVQLLMARMPQSLRDAQRAALRAMRRSSAAAPGPRYSRELALLHSCKVKLPTTKAQERLGFSPPIPFAEACRRSVAWLRFADYPVS